MGRADPGVDAREELLGASDAKADDADDGVAGSIPFLPGNDEGSPGVSLAAVAWLGSVEVRAEHVGFDNVLISVALPGGDAALRLAALVVGYDADGGLPLLIGPGAPARRAAPPDDGDRLGRLRYRWVGVELDGRVPVHVGLAVELAHHEIVANLAIFKVGEGRVHGTFDDAKGCGVGFGGVGGQIPPAQFGVVEGSAAARGREDAIGGYEEGTADGIIAPLERDHVGVAQVRWAGSLFAADDAGVDGAGAGAGARGQGVCEGSG